MLDESILTREDVARPDASTEIRLRRSQEISLADLDLGQVQQSYRESEFKHIELSDLRAFIEEKLRRMLSRNVTRVDFAGRLQDLIKDYNARGRLTNDYFEDLIQFTAALREEEQRAHREGLTEAELEILDLLNKEKLTQAEKQKVKNAARQLLKTLNADDPKVLVQDWHRDSQSREKVKGVIGKVLDDELPESYVPDIFQPKTDRIYLHILERSGGGEVA